MTIKEVFLAKLIKAGYKPPEHLDVWKDEDWKKCLDIFETGRILVFQAIYGNKTIQRGKVKTKEWEYRLAEAESDVANHYIYRTMDYLLTQIKNGDIRI